MKKQKVEHAAPELELTRVLDAPREQVFRAWTESRRLAAWWGPDGFTNPICEVDARPGGALRIEMHAPDGTVYPMSGEFRAIEQPGRLEFISAALDKKNKPLFEVLTTVTCVGKNGKTTQTLHVRVVKKYAAIADQHLAGMEQGWTQSLQRLARYLETNRT